MASTAIPGAGSKLSYSLDGVHFTTVAQLRKFKGPNSKQTILDQTNILTTGNGDAPLPVRFSSGEAEMDGVLSPQNSSQIAMGTLHASLTIVSWQLLLADGVTVYSWSGSVSEFQPFDIDVMKAVAFTAKIRIAGALSGPAGTATE